MKKWLKFNLLTLFILLFSIVTFNLFMDPYWTFSHSHKFNNIQKGTNERQQKANYIFFTDKSYNSLLLGSSRTTYVNPTSFEGLNVFNFSASGMRPLEYLTYIDFVIEDCKQPIENIIIGMDFFGYLDYGLFMFDDAQSIVQNTMSDLYRWKILLSFDTFNSSFKNFRDYIKNNKEDRYDRNIIKVRDYKPHSEEQINIDVKIYANTEYKGNRNLNWNKDIKKITKKYKDKKFIIYTTPISEPLFKKLIELNQYENYENWLRDLVRNFEEVHHFMYLNSFSKDYLLNFADSNHAYTQSNNKIVKELVDSKQNDLKMILTKDNIENQLKKLKKINGVI